MSSQTELSKDEQELLLKSLQDEAGVKKAAQTISLLIRAMQGEAIDPDSVITYFTDIKDLRERSRFPSYPIVAKQVYLRLIGSMCPEAASCFALADEEAHSLISYKGGSREELVDMKKAAAQVPQQSFQIGQTKQPEERKPLRLWQRQKREESEFD